MRWRPPVLREAVVCAALAGTVGGQLAWLGPPGTDFAAHAYQRMLFLRHGFTLWDDFWYAGRYSFVDYSVIYYPLAVLLGIRVLAVGTVAVAAFGFAVVAGREWGGVARWSSRSFAVVLGGFVISAAFAFVARDRTRSARACGRCSQVTAGASPCRRCSRSREHGRPCAPPLSC